MPTPSQKTAVTGSSEHGGYLTEEEEEDTKNNFTQFINELSGHGPNFERKEFLQFDFFRSKSISMQQQSNDGVTATTLLQMENQREQDINAKEQKPMVSPSEFKMSS